jgi:hypothetical protein
MSGHKLYFPTCDSTIHKSSKQITETWENLLEILEVDKPFNVHQYRKGHLYELYWQLIKLN